MEITTKMPKNGYDIKVVRKDDILDCIDSNILDKELMLTFISQLEVDAKTFLSQGRWTSLPYIGTLRKNKFKEIINSEENKELIASAKENLDRDKYIIFRNNLKDNIAKEIRNERVYRYLLSQSVNKNRPFFEYLIDTRGERIARIVCFTYYSVDIKHEL